MLRCTVEYTGLPGLPGYNTIHFLGTTAADAQICVNKLDTFFNSFETLLVDRLTITVSGEVKDIDPATGDTEAVYQVPPVVILPSNTADPIPMASQGLARIRTNQIRRNRQIQGRFNIPGFAESLNDSNGGVVTQLVNDLQGPLTALVGIGSDTQLAVWARPIGAAGGLPGAAGVVATATNAQLWTQWAVLRSRRP